MSEPLKPKAKIWEIIKRHQDYGEISNTGPRGKYVRSHCASFSDQFVEYLRRSGIACIRATSPFNVAPNHEYLLVNTSDQGILLLDVTAEQFIPNVRKLNKQLVGDDESILFCTRDQMRHIYDTAITKTEDVLKFHGFDSLQDLMHEEYKNQIPIRHNDIMDLSILEDFIPIANDRDPKQVYKHLAKCAVIDREALFYGISGGQVFKRIIGDEVSIIKDRSDVNSDHYAQFASAAVPNQSDAHRAILNSQAQFELERFLPADLIFGGSDVFNRSRISQIER